MRCPVCRAENDLLPSCRRCKADLDLLASVETQRIDVMVQARQALLGGDAPVALRGAARAHALRAADDSARLLALGHLMARRYPLALRWCRSAQNLTPEDRA